MSQTPKRLLRELKWSLIGLFYHFFFIIGKPKQKKYVFVMHLYKWKNLIKQIIKVLFIELNDSI